MIYLVIVELIIFVFCIESTQLHHVHANEDTCSAQGDQQCSYQSNDMFELILAQDHGKIDAFIPSCISEIKKRGGHRCWHKHNTFLEHLLGVHDILRLWGENEITGRVGLFHSAYSNSYVNLALFDPKEEAERDVMRSLIGSTAEEIVHLFCIIDRQSVVVDTLLAKGVIPPEGLDVPHLREQNRTVHLTAEILRLLVVFTMADVADQYFGWQDQLFGGEEMVNSMLLPGEDKLSEHDSEALWPGPSRPGLWMTYVSQLGMVARSYQGGDSVIYRVPPVFNNCTEVISREMEAAAIELYWDVVSGNTFSYEDTVDKLEMSSQLNPWFFECHVLLAQKYLHRGHYEKARQSSERALELQSVWGTAYDKRMSFPAWVAWTRVLHAKAVNEEAWPKNSWEVNNFGLVL